jgi:hypothetical protein
MLAGPALKNIFLGEFLHYHFKSHLIRLFTNSMALLCDVDIPHKYCAIDPDLSKPL